MNYPKHWHLGQLVVATLLACAVGCSAFRPWAGGGERVARTPSAPSEGTESNLFPEETGSNLKPTIRGQNDGSWTRNAAPAYAPASAPSYAPSGPAYTAPGTSNRSYDNRGNSASGGYGANNGTAANNPHQYGTSNPQNGPGSAANNGQPFTSYQPGAENGAVVRPNQGVLPPGSSTPGVAPLNTSPGGPGDFVPGYDGSLMGQNFADIDTFVEEARTGRLMFGVGVNSDAGVTGQIVVDERNFDIRRPPTSWDDIASGRAWRGAGQGFRVEAAPGTQVQRYLASFTEPYFLDTPVSMSVSGFYYDRGFFDWNEQRLGGRLAFGYRLTHDLSVSLGLRAEQVKIFDPRVTGVTELDRVVGDNSLYIPQVTIAHDTRDVPFFPTQGHLVELGFQQAFGDFEYSKLDIDLRRYFLVRERPDGSGRHTLALSTQIGLTGTDTPIFENYFAGGFSTLRGFDFRGASPVDSTIVVGGRFQFIGAVEYFFPLTADDMLKGVVFCDFGTVERNIEIDSDNFRVSPGFGIRVNIPALGPAPLAFDFGFPVAFAPTDQKEVFSFFLGIGR